MDTQMGATLIAAVGATFGQYVLVRELGTGGMGSVFEAKHVQLGKRVAVKLLHPTLASSPKALRRFVREGRACSRIVHAHVVEVLDTGVQDGRPYLVMELVEGADLGAWLREKHRLDVAELADIFLPLCSALWAVHQGGIVHRDLKPSNVILTRPRPHVLRPMLVDFGVAKLSFSEATDDLTKSDATVGTVAYMAPEQTRGGKAVQPTADQYALGVMLYECATGRRPFQGESQYDLMHAILHDDLVPPSRYRPELGEQFDALVLRALDRDPAKRFPSVQALGAALLAFGSARAWAAWGPEFCAADAPGGGTEADAHGDRRAEQSASETPAAPLNWGGSAVPPADDPRRPRRLGTYVIAALPLVGISLAVYASWSTPAADAATGRGRTPPASQPTRAREPVRPRVEPPTLHLPAPTSHKPTQDQKGARYRSSESPARPALSRTAAASRAVPKSAQSMAIEAARAEQTPAVSPRNRTEPPRGTNGAFILE